MIGTYQVHCWQHADDIEPAEEYDAVGAFARYPFGTTELVLGFKAYLALGELAPDRTFDLADDRRGAWMRGSFPAADSVEFHLHEQDTMCCWTDADCVGER